MLTVVLALFGLAGCGGEDGAPVRTMLAPGTGLICLPGQVDSCDCGAGVLGVATCTLDGLSMGTCACPQPAGMAPSVPVTSGDGDVVTPMTIAGDGDVGGDGDNVTVPTQPVEPPPPADPRARDIRISEIAMYQAVKVSLAADGEAVVARNAPVIVGKEAFVRVFVEPQTGFTARELAAELTLSSAEAAVQDMRVQQRVDGASSDEDLASTINFDIPGEMITADLQWSVRLVELQPDTATGTIDPAARFPTDEEALEPLGARNAGPLHVMIVPYRYNGDGSGRLPTIDDEQLQIFRDFIYAYYPIIEVTFELHEPVDYNNRVGPNTGWEAWLDSHCRLRQSENPDPKTLYYGLMSPRASMREYGGGVAGISYLPGPAANFGRCSVGLGFPGQQTAFIQAHELGHSLGLPHAPCGVDGGPFPYADAKIGSWGFGLSSRTLKEPDQYYDMMSYCDPAFISDYNFQKLFERVRYLNLQFARVPSQGQATPYVHIVQYADGHHELVNRPVFDEPPGGDEERRPVQLLDEDGADMGEVEGYFLPLADGRGGAWFVPDVGAASAILDGYGQVSL